MYLIEKSSIKSIKNKQIDFYKLSIFKKLTRREEGMGYGEKAGCL